MHLFFSADKLGEAARVGAVETRAQRTNALKVVDAYGDTQALDLEHAQVAQVEEAGHESFGVFAQVDRARVGELFHARGKADCVSLRGVVHAQIVADTSHDDFARIDPHPNRERNAHAALEFGGITTQLVG